jgi:intracellular sulfur oxidation DsrE/DsrF family protein
MEFQMTVMRLGTAALALATAILAASLLAPASFAQAQVKQKAPAAKPAMHKVAMQVSQNDKAVMDLALNNARNIVEYYKDKGETVAIEIVTYGPGLHMLRADTSPVKERIAPMSLENSNIKFMACENTQKNQSKAEGKPVTLISEATLTPSGVVRLMELQKQGYAYIRP